MVENNRDSNSFFENAEQEELYFKMIHTLFYRGFFAADNNDSEPCHFLTEQEQEVYKSMLELYKSIQR